MRGSTAKVHSMAARVDELKKECEGQKQEGIGEVTAPLLSTAASRRRNVPRWWRKHSRFVRPPASSPAPVRVTRSYKITGGRSCDAIDLLLTRMDYLGRMGHLSGASSTSNSNSTLAGSYGGITKVVLAWTLVWRAWEHCLRTNHLLSSTGSTSYCSRIIYTEM